MAIKQVLEKALDLGIPADDSSIERAWIKAAYLFVEYYIYPSIDKSLSIGNVH